MAGNGTTLRTSTVACIGDWGTTSTDLLEINFGEKMSEISTTDYAGFWRRVAAYIVDSLIMVVPIFIVGFVVGLIVMSDVKTHQGLALAYRISELVTKIFTLLIGWIYFATMESSSKQGTFGKMALGIKVTDMDGNKISFGKASGRFFGKILSALILFIGFLMVGFTKKKQGLHDIMADTLVLKKNR